MSRMIHTEAIRLKLDLSPLVWMASVAVNKGNGGSGQIITEQVESQRAAPH